MKAKTSAAKERENRLFKLINACFEKYSEEEMIEMFNQITDKEYKEKPDEEGMITELECNGYTVIKFDSLVQQMRFEAFLEELEANPYQLKLIA